MAGEEGLPNLAHYCVTKFGVIGLTQSLAPGGRGPRRDGQCGLTDYWFYVRHRWVFDLVLSNPDTVKLYLMSPQQCAAAIGCTH